jgi:hypothetical protein
MTPTNTFGRAPFYAPLKRLGNNYYKTTYFNAFVIWFISFVIYLMLIFDLLQKFRLNYIPHFIKYFKNQKISKTTKKFII